MNQTERAQAMRSAGVLDHEIPPGGRADRAMFDRAGYAVGRAVTAPEVIRAVRAPWVEAVIAEGYIEPVDGEPDLFRWTGLTDGFDFRRFRSVVHERIEELLIRPGIASAAIESLWGRRAALRSDGGPVAAAPGDPTRWHRDGWQMTYRGAPGDYVNLWIPLTRLATDGGPLGLAVGSQRMAGRPDPLHAPHPLHLDTHLDALPPDELIAPLWCTTSFEVGDALLFDPYLVHSTMPNDGAYLRLAIGLLAQDATLSVPPHFWLSTDSTRELTEAEWLTLAVLALSPSNPMLTRRAFSYRGVIGRLWTEQPNDLIDRSFKILHLRELIEPHEIQGDSDAAIKRYFHITPAGHKLACEWLATAELTDPRLLAVRLQFCTWLDLDTNSLLRAAAAQPGR